MDRSRVAALLRELADVVEADDEVVKDRPSRPRRARALVPPAGEADELTQARARRLLHDRGYRETPKR